jgi:hypothetical protein
MASTTTAATTTKPFTVRLAPSIEKWIEREAKRTKRSKGAVLNELAEEAIRMRCFRGIGFKDEFPRRRAWVMGTGLDVWEMIMLYKDYGPERRAELIENHDVQDFHIDAALAYYQAYPQEIDDILEENSKPIEYWLEKYPELRRMIHVHEF